jgi:predicted permease
MGGDYKRVNDWPGGAVFRGMGLLTHDLRQAARGLARVPGTAVLCAATLALGIAASSTTFSAVYAALFRPIPFAEPDRLTLLQQVRTDPRNGSILLRWSYAAGEEIRRAARSFDAVGSYSRASVSISGSGDAEQVDGELVNAGYFAVLRVAPVIGQGLTSADDSAARPVALIADSLWRSRFGADPAVVGRSVDVNGVPLTIAGVLPAGFAGVSGRAVLWAPSTLAPRMTYRDYLTTPQHFINVIARVKAGVSIAQASAELAVLGPSLPHPPRAPGSLPADWSATARPLADARIDPAQRRSLLLILGGAGCLLLVTCVNVALVLLTRARMRRGETAIRLALGASRLRLAREFLAESALVAIAGALAGTLLAAWGVAWLRAAAPVILPSAQNT